MFRRVMIGAAAAVLGLGFAPASAATQTVTAQGTSYASVYVAPLVNAAKGDTIKFANNDLTGIAAHTLTLDDTGKLCTNGTTAVPCDTGAVQQGRTGQFTLSSTIAAGQYPFHCNVHPTMRGILNVS